MTPENKLAAFQALMGEMSAAVTDAVAVLKQRGDAGDKIAASLADVLAEVGQAQAGVIDAIQELGARKEQREMATSLAALVSLMEKRKGTDLSGLVASIRQLRITAPDVTVNVEPTPVQVNVQPAPVTVQVMPSKDIACEWEIRLPGMYGAPDRTMTIRKKTVKEN